ncbi:MAG TPA: P-loop NTPase fold protein [Longimicrobiaceae bacterium]|nr:P-loop NTPase fold protein [Longimicrobiaceae bacterium]
MSTVFLSYSHTDQHFAARLRGDLIDRAHTVLWDGDLRAGQNWSEELERWMERAPIHLVVLSPRYLGSETASKELQHIRALREAGRGTLVPLLAEPAAGPEWLAMIQYVDFTRGYEAGLEALLGTLETIGATAPSVSAIEAAPPESKASAAAPPSSPSPANVVATPDPSRLPLGSGVNLLVEYARSFADSENAPITLPEHLAWALFEQGRMPDAQPEAYLLAEWLRRKGRRETFDQLRRNRFGKPRYRPGNTLLSADVTSLLEESSMIALTTSTANTAVETRHLVAELLFPVSPSVSPIAALLEDLGLDVSELVSELRDFIARKFPKDDQHAWNSVLAAGAKTSQAGTEAPGRGVADLASVPEPAAREFTLAASSISDQPAEEDRLGFEPYVRAAAEFLTSEGTRPPLTLSVEGEWGSGKSSFMRQLQESIGERERKLGKKPAVIVWFNPWRHDREDAVWAAFALEFLRGVGRQLPFLQRWRGHLSLLLRRFSWRDGWLDVARALATGVAALAALAILFYVLLTNENAIAAFAKKLVSKESEAALLTMLLKTGGIGASLALAVTMWKQAKAFIGNPLRIDLKKYVRSPDYQSRISFIEHFHEDFGRIVRAYTGERKVYVFIDDLDRCQTPHAADLMQALNLMMGAEEQPIIFILGMDREKIAASLAVKFKDLLPYVTADSARPGESGEGESALRGLEYGSEFIEKFVQISFRVPLPRDTDVAALLRSLSGGERVKPPAGPERERPRIQAMDVYPLVETQPLGPTRPRRAPEAPPAVASEPRTPAEDVREALQKQVSVDSDRLHEIVRMVAPALDYNPRRVKQFVNVFRLRAYLAIATELITARPASPAALTFEKLGKVAAIGLRWPLLIADLEAEPDLLDRLQKRALAIERGSRTPERGNSLSVSDKGRSIHDAVGPEAFWSQRPRLLELLRTHVQDADPETVETHTLEGLDMVPLLRVAAPTLKRETVQAVTSAATAAASVAPA